MIEVISKERTKFMREYFKMPKVIYLTLHDFKSLGKPQLIYGMVVRLDLRKLENGSCKIN